MCADLKMYNQNILINKNEIENMMFHYDPIHLATTDIDNNIILINPISVDLLEHIKYVLGIIVSLTTIYYCILETIKQINRP
jgi:hypothetical protein